MRTLVLLGPQRLRPTLAGVVDQLGVEGRVAAVTAGWQEREQEDAELREHLRRDTVNLELYRRSEELFAADPELFAAHRRRQDRLRELQELYRLRLAHALDAVRELMRRPDGGDLLADERQAAIDSVRALDAHHLGRIREVHASFEETWRPGERPGVAAHRIELAALLADAGALALAGGHVAVLLNRLRIFGLWELLRDQAVFAWSAGAMVLAERIVVFHDSPPQGPGNAEVLDAGLGVCPGILPLPHARRRLQLGDAVRVGLFARRFAPLRPLALDEGAVLTCRGPVRLQERVGLLTTDGRVEELSPASVLEGVA